ncbi:MAG: citrate synthase [Pseudanabaenaceae cyanobacterium SKYGB_i_bin29]|nr:citrate synthase [Pseudanabaenaceae cyanobacterium SKYG29]MDW8422516.1 citrate synthase [Pseudanabaenaceae cyanobacterium SKYGB_i_bin29]
MAVGEYKPGLEGVPATQSNISYIDGQRGILEYRGIRIEELCEHSNFLETAYLLIFGELPTAEQYETFVRDVTYRRRIKYRIRDMIKCFPESGHPMDALQACIAALGMFYPLPDLHDPALIYHASARLIAKMPTMVATFHLMRQGNDPVRPRDDLDYPSNFLYMLNEKEPDPLAARVFDVCLMLHAEHTVNASTFCALVTASTLTDPYTVLTSAIGTLSGPLHGGANEQVMKMLAEIGTVENVRPYLERKIKNKEKIMGFGHRVYKVKDPRATILQELAIKLFDKFGHDRYFDVAIELEHQAKEYLGDKGVFPNVDFYSGLIYRKLGIPTDLFTPIFAIARTAGWLAHWKEQLADNRLFRPTQVYTGLHDVPYTPIEKRVSTLQPTVPDGSLVSPHPAG